MKAATRTAPPHIGSAGKQSSRRREIRPVASERPGGQGSRRAKRVQAKLTMQMMDQKEEAWRREQAADVVASAQMTAAAAASRRSGGGASRLHPDADRGEKDSSALSTAPPSRKHSSRSTKSNHSSGRRAAAAGASAAGNSSDRSTTSTGSEPLLPRSSVAALKELHQRHLQEHGAHCNCLELLSLVERGGRSGQPKHARQPTSMAKQKLLFRPVAVWRKDESSSERVPPKHPDDLCCRDGETRCALRHDRSSRSITSLQPSSMSQSIPIPISKTSSLLSGSVVSGSSSIVSGASPSPASFMNSPAFLSVGTPRSMTAARGGLLPLSQLSPLVLTAQSLFAQSSGGGSSISSGGGGGGGIPPSGSSVGATGGIPNSSIFPSTASVAASLAAGGGGVTSAPSTPALSTPAASIGSLHIHTGSSAQGVLSPPSIPLIPASIYPPTPHSTTAAAAAAHSLAAASAAAAAASSTAAGTATHVSLGGANPRTDSSLRKTKIVCTLGPACASPEMLAGLLHAGMNIARFNFSHGSHEEHAEMLGKLRQACAHTGIDCAFLLDTKGSEIRTGLIKERTLPNGSTERSLELHAGQILLLRTDLTPAQHLSVQGDSVEGVSVDYPRLGSVLSPGSVLKIDDGLIITRVVECLPDRGVRVRVENHSAVLGERKGVNLPGTEVDLEAVTEQDKLDLRFARDQGFHFVAASFTRDAAGIREVRRILCEEPERRDSDEFAPSPVNAADLAAAASAAASSSFFSPAHHPMSTSAAAAAWRRPTIMVIAKIESAQGLSNFESILEASDGIMVARGDLGTEIPIQKVSTAQKMMIRRCNQAGKSVITATQMLESMCVNPRPTRAEATDVSNAVLDGSDAVMLSGETAKGLWPLEALRTMSAICLTSERAMDYRALYASMVASVTPPLRKTEAVTAASVKAAIDMGAAAIIVFSESGASARLAAKYRPEAPIILLTPNAHTHRQSRLLRGVWSLLVSRDRESSLVATALAFAKSKTWLAEGQGQVVILVSGNQPGVAGATNTMRILDV